MDATEYPRTPHVHTTRVRSAHLEMRSRIATDSTTGKSPHRPCFGVHLREVRCKRKAGVPVVLKKLLKAVEATGGFEAEGIFRCPSISVG